MDKYVFTDLTADIYYLDWYQIPVWASHSYFHNLKNPLHSQCVTVIMDHLFLPENATYQVSLIHAWLQMEVRVVTSYLFSLGLI